MTHFECVRVFLPDMGLCTESSGEGQKPEIKFQKQQFWLIFNLSYYKHINIYQRYGRKSIFAKIWKWSVQFSMSFIELINTFVHYCFTQIYSTIFTHKKSMIFLRCASCWNTYHTNEHGETLKTYTKKLKNARFLARFM